MLRQPIPNGVQYQAFYGNTVAWKAPVPPGVLGRLGYNLPFRVYRAGDKAIQSAGTSERNPTAEGLVAARFNDCKGTDAGPALSELSTRAN